MKKKEGKINQKKKNIKKETNKEKPKIVNVINEKEYKIEFDIIKEAQKLKINFILLDKNNNKEFYTKFISLNELKTLNNFFTQFNDYSEAFLYLINNFTKLYEKKIQFINRNQINIVLLFSVKQNNNIYEEGIELSLSKKNIKLKKTAPNFHSIINNLKISLENFNLSIKELKTVIDKDKIDKDKKINELESNINIKLKKFLNEGKLNDLKLKTEKLEKSTNIGEINVKLNDIYSKLEEYNKEIKKIKKEKSNNELVNLKQNFEEKVKLSEKNNENENSLRSIKNKKSDDNINININMESSIEAKINELFNNKMKLLDEKLQIINNKVINLERGQNKLYEKNRNEESFIKDGSFNFGDSIIYDKYDKKIQTINNNLNSKIKKLANKLNVNIKDIELDNSELNNINNNIIDDKTNDLTNNDIKDLNIKLMNDINIKMRNMNNDIENKVRNTLDKFTNEIVNNNMNEIKQELFSLINKVNERGKEDYKELNSKIALFKNEIIKITDSKNNIIDNKIKIVDSRTNKVLKDNQMFLEKINYFDIKIKNLDNKIEINQNNNPNNNINNSNNNNLNNSYAFSSSRNSQNLNNTNEEADTNNKKTNISYIVSSNLNIGNQDKNIDIDSNIIKKEEQTENYFLFNKMKEANPYNRIIKYTLVYRATRDGDSSKIFHSKCDFIGPNITLIKTKKGYIFGGFTYKGWKHLFKDIKKDEPDFGTDLKDEKAFGFSINEKKVYKNDKPNELAISCNNNYGPVFKNNFFKVFDEFLKKGGICGKIEESNFVGQEKDYELNGGEEKFEIEEMEIFQIALK